MTFPLLFKNSEDGFGLLSMVFVILTIGISVVTIMTLINPSTLTKQNRETTLRAATLRGAIQSYQFSHGGSSGTYPPNLDSLVTTDGVNCVMDNTATDPTYLFLQGWCGPYVDQVFEQNLASFKTDGWGTLFNYDHSTGVIKSCGADLTCGDGDDVTFNP